MIQTIDSSQRAETANLRQAPSSTLSKVIFHAKITSVGLLNLTKIS